MPRSNWKQWTWLVKWQIWFYQYLRKLHSKSLLCNCVQETESIQFHVKWNHLRTVVLFYFLSLYSKSFLSRFFTFCAPSLLFILFYFLLNSFSFILPWRYGTETFAIFILSKASKTSIWFRVKRGQCATLAVVLRLSYRNNLRQN
jgi:hypothetical protein